MKDPLEIDPELLVDRLSDMEKAILDKIRSINVQNVIDFNPKDAEIIRSKTLILTSYYIDKVVARLCDEDRNFARYYMSLIIKDMRELSKRRGLK